MGWATQATDDFNRPNADPLDGNWTTVTSETKLILIGSVVTLSGSGADSGSYNTARAWANDQSSSAILTCTGTAGGAAGVGLGARIASGARTYYSFYVDHAGSNNACLRRRVAGTGTTLVTWTQTFSDGDRFTLRVSGPSSAAFLEVLRAGVSVQTYTDNSSLSSGSPGLLYSSVETAATWDDWEGGEYTPDTTAADDPPIGFSGRGAGW